MMKYRVEHDYQDIAFVEIIPSPKSEAAIKEMVEFWSDWEWLLEHCNGNYTTAFLKMLARFILRNRRAPSQGKSYETMDEGWVILDGSYDIKILNWDEFTFDDDATEIEEIPES